jgi:hypothetical protein
MRSLLHRALPVFLAALFPFGCASTQTEENPPGPAKQPAKAESNEPGEPPAATGDFTGTWATDGTGAEGIRTFVQQGGAMTGHFDRMRGRDDGTVSGRVLTGRFWWNEDPSGTAGYDGTPAGQRGEFEIRLSLDGNAFTGRSRYDGAEWVSWNGIKTGETPAAGEAEGKVQDFTGTWATDGTGAEGIRTFVQQGGAMTGHFDEMRGRYDGTVSERKLTGRFWWNEDPSGTAGYDGTPAGQRGEFEITLSLDGDAFTGRSRYDGAEWVSWNGIRVSEKGREGQEGGK